MENILIFVLLIFAAAAITECFLGFSAARRAIEGCMAPYVMLVPVSGDADNTEMLLRDALHLAERSEHCFRIIICDMGTDPDASEICRLFAREHDIRLCSREEAELIMSVL